MIVAGNMIDAKTALWCGTEKRLGPLQETGKASGIMSIRIPGLHVAGRTVMAGPPATIY